MIAALLSADALPLMLGAIIGLILALTGAGGGILAVPLLVFALHLPLQQAAPTALLAVGLSALLGAGLAHRDGLLRYRAAAMIGVAGVLTAPLGVALAHRLPDRPLLAAFALVLGYASLRTWRSAAPRAANVARVELPPLPCVINPGEGRLRWTLPCARALAGIGALAGVLSGLLGVGGGFVIVPALRRYTDIAQHSVVATSLGVIALVSAGGVVSATVVGSLPWALALPFAIGALLGLLLGRRLASRLPGPRLQQAFAIVGGLVMMLLLARAGGILPTT